MLDVAVNMRHWRILAARFMIRLGRLLQTLAVSVMRPDDLIEFSRRFYADPASVKGWSRADILDEGLAPEEKDLLERSPVRSGRLLLLGVGGGREAIALAREGFQVTGVDFVAGMIESAKANATGRGISIEGLVQEISRLDVPEGSHDLAWLSARMYSCIPTRRRRTAMLRRIARALRSGGCFICQFHWEPRRQPPWLCRLHRAVARLTLGHLQFEPGDALLFGNEFLHAFADRALVTEEFNDGGFTALHWSVSGENQSGGAVLQKKVSEA